MANVEDNRKIFFYNVAANFLLKNPIRQNLKSDNFNGIKNLETFLNVEHSLKLCAYLSDSEKYTIDFNTEIKNIIQNSKIGVVIFFKSQSNFVTEENINSLIQVSYFNGQPVSLLYSTLEHVFVPIFHNGKINTIAETIVEEQIIELQSKLRSCISNIESEKSDIVSKLEHEFEYWKTASKSGKRSTERHSAAAFRDILEHLVEDFRKISTLQFLEVEDLLESAHNVFDDLWRHEKYNFPQQRMANLLEITSNTIIVYAARQFEDVKVWSDPFNKVSAVLEKSVKLVTQWTDACDRLTKLFWPNHSLHSWNGDPYVPRRLLKFADKWKEVLNLRTLHNQLTRLLTKTEQQSLKTADFFEPFQALDIFQCSPYSEPEWQLAVSKFESSLKPVEERVAKKLKTQLGNVHVNTRQLLYEFIRYGELISRPIVRQVLTGEREQLLSALRDYLQGLTKLETNEVLSPNVTDMPQVVRDIVTLKQYEIRVFEVKNISEKILSDLHNFPTFNQFILTLTTDLKQQHTDLFDSWIRQTTRAINNQTLSLKEDEPVVQFSASKLMCVNYSPKLVNLIQEVRQLSAFGYKVPANIQEVAKNAKKFLSQAKALEQVASFHNTVGDRMIMSQRPMMLNAALNLAKLVQEEATVHWSDVESVGKYVISLRMAVDKLSTDNILLNSYHSQLAVKVAELAETDLIRQQYKWKDGITYMRDVMHQVSEHGFSNMRAWKLHWDQELSKALERQYVIGLDHVHQHLPEISADLVFRFGKVQYNPPLEELRMKYYSQLKRYLSIPYSFRGVGDLADGNVAIFSEIVDRNFELLTPVYESAEDLMDKLFLLAEQWKPWLALGLVDLDKMSDEHLKTWQDWDVNFRDSKSFGQKIAKLTSWEERVGCFTISLSAARSEMESQNRRYWSALVTSLQASVSHDTVIIDSFINNAATVLSKQPRTAEDVTEIHISHAEILTQVSQMTKLYEDLQQRNKILASWCKDRIEETVKLQGPWEHLNALVSNHQNLIEKQIDGIKNNLTGACAALCEEMERWSMRWEEMKPKPHVQSLADLSKGLKVLREQRVLWDSLIQRKVKLESDCTRFGIDRPVFDKFENTEKDLEKEEEMWIVAENFTTELQQIWDEEWIVFRKQTYRLEEFLLRWLESLQNDDPIPLSTSLLQEIHKYKAAIPAFKYIRGEDFTQKHWIEIYSLLDIPIKTVDELTVGHFLSASEKLSDPKTLSNLQAINKKAASEVVVRQALSELDTWEVQARFTLIPHSDSRGIVLMVIKDFKDVLNTLGDNQCLLQSVKTSADYESFSERGSAWETRLTDLNYYVTSLNHIQHKWIYLEPIFGRGTLRHEQARFQRIDKEFRILLETIQRDSRVSALSRVNDMKNTVTMLVEQLARCQASLNNFLTEKRNKFPRFLFLGDDDLLEILGQSMQENVIQAHLKKLFSGIHSVDIDASVADRNNMKTESKIVALKSLQGERVLLKNHVSLNKPVEDWLEKLVREMQHTLQQQLLECLADTENKKKGYGGPDPLKYASQILCLAANIFFTKRAEQAIKNGNLRSLLESLKEQRKHYTNLDITKNEDGENVLNLKLKSLLLDIVHQISIVEELIDNNVSDTGNWYWRKRLRYYINSDGTAIINMSNAKFSYSYEYLGNSQKLVYTSLTDKCFLTLTQAMHLGLGGNPYGPAGTGKTESVKALGGILGRQVLVFNCDEGIDAKSMARILIGLARSGAWGCFDEFNRLDEGTLSAVSSQIQAIQTALVGRVETFTINEQKISLNPHCGIFVTLNPAGGGYGARNQLPDNLKQLFRPVVMSEPDQEDIVRVLLFADGYQHAKALASKLCELFYLARNLLSNQQHYDWGLRAMKTVVSACGVTLQQSKLSDDEQRRMSQETELVISTVRLNTMSKLTYRDCELFDVLIKDTFLTVEVKTSLHEKLIFELEKSSRVLNLQVNKRQIQKCVELFEQLKQRMGVVIVGPSGSGKSTLRKLLLHSLINMKHTLKERVFNPKAMPRSQLLGRVDPQTRQWLDGVLTINALEAYNEPQDVWTWMVCDGDIDPEWIEALNSVLDDNRLLTLPSGWRIQFQPNVNFVFETHELIHASPATISRMGIIYLSDEDLKTEDIVKTWLKKQSINETNISMFIDDYFYKAYKWLLQNGQFSLKTSQTAVIFNGISQLRNINSRSSFAVALVYGFGSMLNASSREQFIKQVLEWTKEYVNTNGSPLNCYYDIQRDCIDVHTTDHNLNIQNSSNDLPLVLTGTVKCVLNMLTVWINSPESNHLLLVGPQGSAKSLILNHLIKDNRDFQMITINCSPTINPQYILHKLTQYCVVVNSNKGGRIFRPKRQHVLLHLKGMHCLKTDQWGTNMLSAFLHQLITYGGVYDQNIEWTVIERVTVIGTLHTTDVLPTRITSIFKICTVDPPDQEDLSSIYSLYITHILKSNYAEKTSWISESKVTQLTNTLLSFYHELQKNFTVVNYHHYEFSLHELTECCKNLLRYNSSEVQSDEDMFDVICHELFRTFSDKLVSIEDQTKFIKLLRHSLTSHWGVSQSAAVSRMEHMFFIADDASNNTKLTKINTNDWVNVIKKVIQRFASEDGQSIKLPIFTELLQMVSRIQCKLISAGGSILLAGRAGIGRKTATKIAAQLCGAQLVIPNPSNTQFKLDLKNAIQNAGIEGNQVFVIIEDNILTQTSAQEILHMLLSSGDVPQLFGIAETENIISLLRDQMEQDEFEGDLLQYFHSRVKKNLHIVIILDVMNPDFNTLLDNNPQITQKCSIIWKDCWSEPTLSEFPHLIITEKSDIYKSVEMPDGFDKIHNNVDNSLQTPARYITFIDTYINIYQKNKQIFSQRCEKLQAGISRLTEAEKVVDSLKASAAEQEKYLADRQSKANEALEMIASTMKNAHVHKEELQELKERTVQENKLLVERKHAIELELAEVEPLILEARAAVGNIRPESLSEIRSLRAPPDVIRDILEGVLRLMGILDTSWNSMKMFLSKRGIKEEIRSFDASRINAENRQAVEKLLAARKGSFETKTARRASVAAAPLAAWVTANVRYSQVLEKIRPLEQEQQKLQQNMQTAEQQISRLSSGLNDVDETVTNLKIQLSSYSKEAAETEIKLTAAQNTLLSAQGLVNKLQAEFVRWQDQLTDLSEKLHVLPIESLLAAACVTYIGSEPEENRRNIIKNWSFIMKYTKNDTFSLKSLLCSEKQQLLFLSEELPSDDQCLENAIITLESKLCPLILDPSLIAMEWLKMHFKNRNIEIINQNSSKFISTLELAVRFGKILIIEEVDTINSILLPILRRHFVYRGERTLVFVSNRLVDLHKDFQMFLISRDSNLKLPSNLVSLITIIDFTSTKASLVGQLISSAVRQENPELEERKHKLLKKREELQLNLEIVQDRLLETLADAKGNILENKELLISLNETKSNSAEITSALQESAKLHNQMLSEYDVFKPVAEFASCLYFAITEMSRVNILYQVSVPVFTRYFLKILPKFNDEGMTIDKVKHSLLSLIYQSVSRSLFKSDRLMFALHLLHRMYSTEISEIEWDVFIRQPTLIEKLDVTQIKQNVPEWVPEDRMQDVFLIKIALNNLYASLQLENFKTWENFMNTNQCEIQFPSEINPKPTVFEQLLIVQALRPDRLHTAMMKTAAQLIGLRNLNLGMNRLSQIYQETSSEEPILLMTSPGANPCFELRDLAKKIVGIDKYLEIAIGETEKSVVLQHLTEFSSQGAWLCLKNLHLATDWLQTLCQSIKSTPFHLEFRLWLITEPHHNFSSVLTQSSFVVAYESPPGIKQNLLRTYSTWNTEIKKDKINSTKARIYFILAYLHALLQERRNYIPQGWSKYYDFSDGDIIATKNLIDDILTIDTNNRIQWAVIRGLCATAVYGGRIDNGSDEKVLESYMRRYLDDGVLSHMWKPPGVNSALPVTDNINEYVTSILKFSDQDSPVYFGLPENIERAWEITNSYIVISRLKDLFHARLEEKKPDQSEWQKKLTPVLGLWKRLNQAHDWLKIRGDLNFSIASNVPPLKIFIENEYLFAVRLIQSVHKCLVALSKILKGTLLPAQKLVAVGNSLVNNKTPDLWSNKWSGPSEPLFYLRAIMSRAETINNYRESNLSLFLQTPIDLSNFFHPESLFASLKQQTARDKNISPNSLTLECTWNENKSNSIFIKISNLQLEGAIFVNGTLLKCENHSPNICTVPTCTVYWSNSVKDFQKEECLSIPLYYSNKRQKHLLDFKIKITESIDSWLQANPALYIQ